MSTFLGRFLILTDLATGWNAADPVLMNGELGVADPGSSAPVLKVGDGVRPWSALPQISGSGGSAANDYVVGTTTTLAPGSFATVTIDNTLDPPTISFGIPRGDTGPANTLNMGTTTTGAPGTPASATITGTPPAQTLNLIIPQGDVGPPGDPGADGASGPTGANGPANELTIGTVTTGAPGTPADATITGTPPAQQLNLTIPRGADGAGLVMVDPTGVIGLTMVPGVAATTARSDSAPPLSQAIAPIWTGQHLFRGGVARAGVLSQVALGLVATVPLLGLTNSGAPTDAKTYEFLTTNAGELVIQSLDEAGATARDILRTSRTGAANSAITFGNVTDNPSYLFAGTGVTTVAGQIVVGAPAGGATGAGTINASAFFDDGVQLVNATAAAPSALVGTVAIPGAAVTLMRSDAAPAINQGMSPQWTGVHNFGSAASMQTTATIGARGRVNAFEFGHSNPGGFEHTLGYARANGRGFLAFHAEHGTADNTFRTRGVMGRVIQSDSAGGLIIGRVTNVNADDQNLTTDLSISSAGVVSFVAGVNFGGIVDFAGQVTIAGQLIISSTSGPVLRLTDGDAATDEKQWRVRNLNGTFIVSLESDAGTEITQALAFGRTGTVLTSMNFGSAASAPTYNFLGAGAIVTGGAIKTTAGAIGVPSHSFSAEPTTGMYRRAAGALALSALSVNVLTAYVPASLPASIGQDLALVSSVGSPNAGQLLFGDGSGWNFQIGTRVGSATTVRVSFLDTGPTLFSDGVVGAPGIGFLNDADTGIYRAATGDIRFACDGVVRLVVSGVQVRPVGVPLLPDDGSVTNPIYSFSSDTNLGLYRIGADVLGVTTGGVLSATFAAGSFVATGTAGASSIVNSVAVAIRDFAFSSNGVLRWSIRCNGTAEGGSNAGSDFQILRRDDAGASLGAWVTVTRATGSTTFSGAAFVFDNAVTVQGTIRAPDGTVALPAFTFASDLDTGVYRIGTNLFGVSVGGVLAMQWWNNTGIGMTLISDGSAAIPGLAFSNDADTGIYSPGANRLRIVTGGITAIELDANHFLQIPDGSAALPSITFQSDTDTGLYHASANIIGVACNGLKCGDWGANFLTVVHATARAELRIAGFGRTPGTDSLDLLDETTQALVWQRANLPLGFGTNGLQRFTIAANGDATFTNAVSAPSFTTTSSRAIKRETGAPRRASDILARLRPIFYRLLAGGDAEQLGLIAEEVHDVCPQLSDGKTVAYDRLAILLLAAWQDDHAAVA